jgi:dimethylargininase
VTPRTSAGGIAQLAGILAPAGYEVSTVPVTGCLHLKSAVSEIAERTLLIKREWVPPEAFAQLRLIAVDSAEPFAANAVRVGDVVIHPAEFPRTRARMEAEGIVVRAVPASELAKAEGGVTCCSLLFRVQYV